jgi:hypothetical protein
VVVVDNVVWKEHQVVIDEILPNALKNETRFTIYRNIFRNKWNH